MSLEAPYFSSPCLTPKRKSRNLVRHPCRRESVTKTAHQMLLVHWLMKITNDPIIQGARPINVVRVGSNKDCGNRVTLYRSEVCRVRTPVMAGIWTSAMRHAASVS